LLQESVTGQMRMAVGQPWEERMAHAVNTYGIRVLIE